MSNTHQSQVTLATTDLETILGGAGLGPFPGAEVGTAAQQGVNETIKQWPNIKNAFNDAHRWGHENGWAAINGVKNAVGSAFSGSSSSTSGASVPTGVP